MLIRVRYIILFAVFFAASCGSVKLTTGEVSPRESVLIIWAHSDIQPRSPEQKIHYETAIKDVKNFPFVPDMAIVAGDLVHRGDSQKYWDWMKELRAESTIPLWYEIAGNHDLNDAESYARNSGKPRHYAVRYGNILFIFLSDEVRSAVTEISDGAFEWWKDLVIKNSDSIIVTVTHAALKQSGLISTFNSTMCIEDSKRFWDVIRKHPVDLWISAHTHLPNFIAIKTSAPEDCKTLFLDISSIHKTTGSPVESWMLIFKNGSNALRCLPRDHEGARFYRQTAFTRELSHPFVSGDRKAVMISTFD
ncbi:MAG: metallophosphoesterase [Spirochaetia bacterium]|jgi:hypothetical protein|nr:metallophosphoesterase [Spirochaetia bacterium]